MTDMTDPAYIEVNLATAIFDDSSTEYSGGVIQPTGSNRPFFIIPSLPALDPERILELVIDIRTTDNTGALRPIHANRGPEAWAWSASRPDFANVDDDNFYDLEYAGVRHIDPTATSESAILRIGAGRWQYDLAATAGEHYCYLSAGNRTVITGARWRWVPEDPTTGTMTTVRLDVINPTEYWPLFPHTTDPTTYGFGPTLTSDPTTVWLDGSDATYVHAERRQKVTGSPTYVAGTFCVGEVELLDAPITRLTWHMRARGSGDPAEAAGTNAYPRTCFLVLQPYSYDYENDEPDYGMDLEIPVDGVFRDYSAEVDLSARGLRHALAQGMQAVPGSFGNWVDGLAHSFAIDISELYLEAEALIRNEIIDGQIDKTRVRPYEDI